MGGERLGNCIVANERMQTMVFYFSHYGARVPVGDIREYMLYMNNRYL